MINISSPRNAQATQQDPEEQQEEEQVPRVVVSISADGFRLIDQRNLPAFATYTAPVSRCGGGGGAPADGGAGGSSPHAMAAAIPPTICLLDGTSDADALVDRLDYASLYNRLVEVRMNPAWFDAFAEEGNTVVSILGDPEIPFEVLVKVMDTARYFLQAPGGNLDEPSASANIQNYMLGGGTAAPTQEDLQRAEYLTVGADGNERVELFPDPVLLLPRPGAGG